MKTKTTIELDLTKLGVEKAILDENANLKKENAKLNSEINKVKADLCKYQQLEKNLVRIEDLSRKLVNLMYISELVSFQDDGI
jgi:hypothetical protein